MPSRLLPILLTLTLATATASAQVPADQKLTFEVAAVRQNKTGNPPTGDNPASNVPLGPGDVYAVTGGLLTVKNMPFAQFVVFAYKLTDGQFKDLLKAAPEWVAQDRFDIQARTEKPNVTKDEMRLMMRALLADRFAFAAHYEPRTISVLAMRLIKPGTPGPRLRLHPANGCSSGHAFPKEPNDAPPPPETVEGGFPAVCGGLLRLPGSTPASFSIGASDIPMAIFTGSFQSMGGLDRPVVDETGLTSHVDFALDYVPKHPDPPPGQPAPPEEQTPNFIESIRKQLGIKLDPEKHEVQALILDHIAPLTEN